jgi:hypothetical protein
MLPILPVPFLPEHSKCGPFGTFQLLNLSQSVQYQKHPVRLRFVVALSLLLCGEQHPHSFATHLHLVSRHHGYHLANIETL